MTPPLQKTIFSYRRDAAVCFLRASVLMCLLQPRSARDEFHLGRSYLADARQLDFAQKLRQMMAKD